MLPEITVLKSKRRQLNISQRELSKMSGVSQGAIAKIENGKVNPSYSTVKKIFDILTEAKASEELKASDLMTSPVLYVSPKDSVKRALHKMVKGGFSQVPVVEKGIVVGRISEKILVYFNKKKYAEPCSKIMGAPLPIVPKNSKESLLREILKVEEAVIVTNGKSLVGIVTKNDLLK